MTACSRCATWSARGVPGYLEQALSAGQTLGYDPRLHSPEALERLRAAATRAGAALKPVADNPLDQAWGAARPAQPAALVVPQPLDYAGEASSAKRGAHRRRSDPGGRGGGRC